MNNNDGVGASSSNSDTKLPLDTELILNIHLKGRLKSVAIQ